MLPRREDDLDSADPFLPLVLGIVSVLRRLDAALELLELPVEPSSHPRAGPVESPAATYAVLGVISLKERLCAHLRDEAIVPSQSASFDARSFAGPEPRPELRGLLR